MLGKPCGWLAGKSTLNRVEHAGKIGLDRHYTLDHDVNAIARLPVDIFPDAHCYLPLYVFCGRHLLAARLRPSSADAADGAKEEIARIVAQIRVRWPRTTIVIRADSGFCRNDLMDWCEANNVQYVLGLAGNTRLKLSIAPQMRTARAKARRTGKPARASADFEYLTRRSWSCKRRVIGKAEWTNGAANPRFIVCQGDLFADRTPAPTMRANQLRLWLASFAYILMCAVRRIGLAGTRLESATCGTIRLTLLKIGALVTISFRRVKLAFASACPSRDVFVYAQQRLCG